MKQSVILGLLFLTLISVATICDAQDLVLHLSFDELEGKVVKDMSDFGNDATFNKGNPKLIDGMFGKAMAFDGKTAGEIADHPSLDIKAERQSRAVLRKARLGFPVCITLQHFTTAGLSFNFSTFQKRVTTTILGPLFRTVNGIFSPERGMVMTSYSILTANWKQTCLVKVN